jgi:hypothetical protein
MQLERLPIVPNGNIPKEKLKVEEKVDEAPKLGLKQLPSHLRYVLLGNDNTYPVIISTTLSEEEEGKLLRVLRAYQSAIG